MWDREREHTLQRRVSSSFFSSSASFLIRHRLHHQPLRSRSALTSAPAGTPPNPARSPEIDASSIEIGVSAAARTLSHPVASCPSSPQHLRISSAPVNAPISVEHCPAQPVQRCGASPPSPRRPSSAHKMPALPSLSQIPEESPSDTEEHEQEPRSPTSFDYPRAVTNFSRPRASSASRSPSIVASPVSETPPNIGSFFPPALRIHQPYARSERTVIAPRFDDDNLSYDENDAAAPPPVVRTHADRDDLMHHLRTQNPNTWIYKPYADSVVSSDASSFMTDETVTETDDSESISESIAESTTTGRSSIDSDFAFDGQMGWQPRPRMSQAERERQRWAAPVIRPAAERNPSYDRYTRGGEQSQSVSRDRRDRRHIDLNTNRRHTDLSVERMAQSLSRPPMEHRDSWLSSGSEGTARTTRTRSRSRSRERTTHKAYVDVFEAAADSRAGLNSPARGTSASAAAQGLHRSASSGTRESGHSSKSDRSRGRTEHRRGNSYGSDGSRQNSSSTSMTMSSLSSNDWKSSDVDTSSLSAEKLAKLKKKGINPSLYLEMKAAKKGGGKRRIGILNGNSFLM
ncbi:hypothetical protein K461DRAFT_77264 [Myriangium duriaei CBS 260.36]|uniref:Uncharacterized protein n=1 Tax=Myriangium duriaei CBS 260.36 TaxID=1168546 RepID=A0A9P4J9G7_9PEZI|nr:hypothetical protein K461DRAFT_77264 [Myriangium duriaei CBS 260.36]